MEVIRWYVVLQVFGLIGVPIAYRLFAGLPSRGWLFAKPLALLLTGYLFWLAGILGFLTNSTPSALFALLLVGLIGARFAWLDRAGLRAFLYEQRGVIIGAEAVFLAFFLFGIVFRAYNPALNYTEKPMDLLFLNALLRSPAQPPHDPWLAGYAVSYYYFGYLLVSILVRFADVTAGVGFNLALAAIMGLTGAGAFAIVHDLLSVGAARSTAASRLAVALLGALFVAFIGNLEGVVEFLNAHGLGTPEFYAALSIKGLPPTHDSPFWFPDDNWWWWRASRVLATGELEVIDEFPFFSFLIADLHPHVMALPVALTAVALSFATLVGSPAAGDVRRVLPPLAWLYPLIFGALGFLNSWDFPTYTALVVLAYAAGRIRARGLSVVAMTDTALFGTFVGGLGLALYVPFYLTFSSQASGIKFDWLMPRTTAPQLVLFWGFFLFIVAALIAVRGRAFLQLITRSRIYALFAGACLLAFLFVSLVQWWAASAAIAVVAVALPLALSPDDAAKSAPSRDDAPAGAGQRFTWLLLALGFGLVFLVEFVFIRDSFGTRMNTVFKFYYQAWVLIALASAVAVHTVTTAVPAAARVLWLGTGALLFAGTLYYPLAAFATQTNQLQRDDVTLDGTAYMHLAHRADAVAIEWLRENAPPSAVVLEAVGGQYSDYGRVSSQTGIPTLLGWGGHELQWRGNGDEAARREPVVQRIYTSADVAEVRDLLKAYGVTHIFAGELERTKYGSGLPLSRMASVVDKVYDRLGTAIYRVK